MFFIPHSQGFKRHQTCESTSFDGFDAVVAQPPVVSTTWRGTTFLKITMTMIALPEGGLRCLMQRERVGLRQQ